MLFSGSTELIKLLTAFGLFVAILAVAMTVRGLLFRTLVRWARATDTQADKIVAQNLRWPSIAWCLLIALYVALDQAHLPPRPAALTLKIVYGLLVLSVTAAVANLAGTALKHALQERHLPIPATGLSFTVFKVSIWTMGLLVLLGSLGVSVTPILTALGVGGLAVALALQETLSNFFAGIHLLLSRPIRVGDFVKLETAQEGYVVDIGWRSTKLRTLQHNIVVVPNSKMAQSILINYSMPEQRLAMPITIGVSYDADPDQVERALLDEAQAAIGPIPGLLADPAPTVRFVPGFGDSSLNFTLTCHVREFEDQAIVQHELHKRILKRFRHDGIEIPFPHRTVHLIADRAAASASHTEAAR
ncbi:MAG: mechanosensitive ion channel family protein [Nitrospiraceae bacterium]